MLPTKLETDNSVDFESVLKDGIAWGFFKPKSPRIVFTVQSFLGDPL